MNTNMITFKLKYVNKYGGASYKATNRRDTSTIYVSPNSFTGKPVKEIQIAAEGFVNPLDVIAASQKAAESKKAAAVAKKEKAAKASKAKAKSVKKVKVDAPVDAPVTVAA